MSKDIFRNRVRLRHLDCFVMVAQTQNLAKAATNLRLTQPAISKTLTELEEITGVKLLDRSRLGTRLTREGEVFLAHAVAVLDALDAANSSINTEQEPLAEAIHLGALPTVAPDILPAALAEFRRLHPHVRVSIQTATNAALLHMLKAGEVDFALARMADPDLMVGLSFEWLYAEQLVLAVRPGHPLLDIRQVSLADVAAYPIIVSAKGTVPRHNTESYFRSHGLKIPSNCIETLSVSLARQLARQSDAVWVTPIGAVRADITNAMLAKLQVTTSGTEEPVGLMRRSEGTPSQLALTLMALFREMAAARTAKAALEIRTARSQKRAC